MTLVMAIVVMLMKMLVVSMKMLVRLMKMLVMLIKILVMLMKMLVMLMKMLVMLMKMLLMLMKMLVMLMIDFQVPHHPLPFPTSGLWFHPLSYDSKVNTFLFTPNRIKTICLNRYEIEIPLLSVLVLSSYRNVQALNASIRRSADDLGQLLHGLYNAHGGYNQLIVLLCFSLFSFG